MGLLNSNPDFLDNLGRTGLVIKKMKAGIEKAGKLEVSVIINYCGIFVNTVNSCFSNSGEQTAHPYHDSSFFNCFVSKIASNFISVSVFEILNLYRWYFCQL